MSGKLVPLSSKEVEKILKRNGFVDDGQDKHGRALIHPDDPCRRTTVPHRNDIVKGTLRTIIREAGKPREDFAR